MRCGVKFCGGCNPKFDRGQAVRELRSRVGDEAELCYAEEGVPYDALLVVSGCPNCCASCEGYDTSGPIVKLFDENGVDDAFSEIERLYKME